MALVMVGKMSEEIVRRNQLQNGVTKKFQRLVVTTVQQQHNTTLTRSFSFSFISLWQVPLSICILLGGSITVMQYCTVPC